MLREHLCDVTDVDILNEDTGDNIKELVHVPDQYFVRRFQCKSGETYL